MTKWTCSNRCLLIDHKMLTRYREMLVQHLLHLTLHQEPRLVAQHLQDEPCLLILSPRQLLVARVLLSLSWRVLESNTAAPTRGVSDACDDECESEVGHEDEEEPQSHVDEDDSQSLGDEEQSPVDTDEEASAPAAKPRVEEVEMAKEDKDVHDSEDVDQEFGEDVNGVE